MVIIFSKRSIERAVQSGADAVKLQKILISLPKRCAISPKTKTRYGNTYGEYRKALELNHEFVKLKEFSEN